MEYQSFLKIIRNNNINNETFIFLKITNYPKGSLR